MPTYKDIQHWVEENRGLRINHTCWIAHCKAIASNAVRPELARSGEGRKVPCPEEKMPAIFDAFSALGIPNGKRASQ